jgi:nucleotide-binding universal stress UspA family protein
MTTALAPAITRVGIENILFPTDFSPQSEAAFEYAKLLARRYEATIHAVHVFTPELYGALPAEALATAVVRMRQEAHARMDALHLRMQGLPHQTFVWEGPLWDVLAEIMKNQACDLIVLGTSARTGLERMLLGSVAEEIFRRADRPVLTVGPKAKKAEEDVRLDRILCATDFSQAADEAAAYAVALAQEYQAHLTMLHVVEEAHGEFQLDPMRVSAYLTDKLRALIPPDAELWCEPEMLLQMGRPAERIVETAGERRANLVVLGARKTEHPVTATHFRWPTAAHVVHDAACPVLTVRG